MKVSMRVSRVNIESETAESEQAWTGLILKVNRHGQG